jgi:integrase
MPGQKKRMLCDGGGLYLQIRRMKKGAISKSWLFRFDTGFTATTESGKTRHIERFHGIGPLYDVSLAQAREKASELRNARREGIDPIEAKKQRRAANAIAAVKSITFDECTRAYLTAHRAGWSMKHAQQFENTMTDYASPIIGRLPVGMIDTPLIIKVLEQELEGEGPLWSVRAPTAQRLRGRIEKVVDWAATRGYRSGENPARWKGHLKNLWPEARRVRAVKHHEALPYAEIPAFMAALRAVKGMPARALEFTILTVARSNEVLGAKWEELDPLMWIVPKERMKGRKEHRVPFAREVANVFRDHPEGRDMSGYLFPREGDSSLKLNHTAMRMVLVEIGYKGLTVHGFRSTFRQWAADKTSCAREVVEMCLAHKTADATEAAYQRSDLFEKRRKLMQQWAQYCMTPPAAKSEPTVTSLTNFFRRRAG